MDPSYYLFCCLFWLTGSFSLPLSLLQARVLLICLVTRTADTGNGRHETLKGGSECKDWTSKEKRSVVRKGKEPKFEKSVLYPYFLPPHLLILHLLHIWLIAITRNKNRKEGRRITRKNLSMAAKRRKTSIFSFLSSVSCHLNLF